MDPGERAILVAWYGANCNLKEIWKLTQAPGTVLSFPRQIQFFMDPYRVISTYTGCRLHPSKSKLDSLSLGVVWKHLFGGNLNGAHDSQVDAKAQTDIIVHEHFVPFVNRTQSIQEIENIFTARQQNEWKKTMEPLRPVHSPWLEQTADQNVEWQPSFNDKYTGPNGGPPAGPSSSMRSAAKAAKTLADIFLFIVLLTFFL